MAIQSIDELRGFWRTEEYDGCVYHLTIQANGQTHFNATGENCLIDELREDAEVQANQPSVLVFNPVRNLKSAANPI